MIKVLVYEKKGFSIFYRRLDEGSFLLPAIASDQISYKTSTEQIMSMLQDEAPNYQPSLFAEVGNLRIYKEVPAEYLKALLSCYSALASAIFTKQDLQDFYNNFDEEKGDYYKEDLLEMWVQGKYWGLVCF